MDKKVLYSHLPESPGVYIMRGSHKTVLYIGKAVQLKRRVSSYFLRANNARIERLVSVIKKIDYVVTETALEALILEASLIKRYQPPFNIKEKDDKSFLYIEITREVFPRILLVRGTEERQGRRYGPFVSAAEVRNALRIIRKIFPFNTHRADTIGMLPRPCFEYEIHLCPGTCCGSITKSAYQKTVRNVRYILEGKKKRLIQHLEKEMQSASKKLCFEEAERIRRQLVALAHIRDTALIKKYEDSIVLPQEKADIRRIEGYDISNISGTSAVGVMVVFRGGKPDKRAYRKFKIRTVHKQNDVGMLKEVLCRRIKNDWPLPDLFVIDGGIGQVNGVLQVLSVVGISMPVVGIAKGVKRDRNDFIGRIPPEFPKDTLIRVRDEAHRFAIAYHRYLRSKTVFSSP
ncbi:MAG: excinuclease ABC subunit UvrC [bacterium]